MTNDTPAVFLSYASQDAEAVARIAEALRGSGVEVWFDKDELVGGDAWDAKIRKQIAECALFLPIISAATQARLEGYFRLEWKLAAQRTHTMAEEKLFLLPIVIDATRDADAKVPSEFRAVQWTRLPAGETPAAFCARVKKLLGGEGAPVSNRRSETGDKTTNTGQRPLLPRNQPSRPWLPPAILGVAAIAALALWQPWRAKEKPAPPAFASAAITPSAPTPIAPEKSAAVEKSLVVLPLENLSPDPENALFTDGIHAEIISTLSQIADLKVISRDSSLTLKGSNSSLAEKAQKLGVANVLSGSVRRAGNTVRIQLELRRASDEAVLWSLPKGDHDLKDWLGLQSEIADQVARALQARESKGSYGGAKFTTKNPEAFDLFLKAHELFDRRQLLATLEAVHLLEEAVRLDPNFGGAVRLLAQSQLRVSVESWDQATRVRYAREGKHWAERAQKLMPGGAGDGVLSNFYSISENDFVRALPLAENAVRALPNDAESHHYLGLALLGTGRLDDNIAQMRRASELEPTNQNYPRNLLLTLADLRREPECRAALEKYRSLMRPGDSPHNPLVALFKLTGETPKNFDGLGEYERAIWLWRVRRFADLLVLVEKELAKPEVGNIHQIDLLVWKCDALIRLGRAVDAQTAAHDLVSLAEQMQTLQEVGPTTKPWWLALAYSRTGRGEEAVAAARRFVEATSPVNQIRYRLRREAQAAEILAFVGRRQECIEALGKLLSVPCSLTVPMLKIDPTWDNMRDDPAFKALLADPKNSAPL